jgi:hypothetical protein
VTTVLIALAALAVGVAAAARSTWSPCGVSMLATVTPLAERGRGHRYRSTAAWFVAGGAAGGATLGLATAALAAGVRAAGTTATARAWVSLAACLVTVAAEVGLAGFRLPVHRRQVNERWLDGFRPWVYGLGFGWQVGVGLATYIVTPALYLMIVLSCLSGSPWAALAVGTVFGLVRGLAVLLGGRITSTESLTAFHRRFHRAERPVRLVLVTVECGAAVACATLVSAWAGLGVAVVVVVVVALRSARPVGRLSGRTSRSSIGEPVAPT